MMIQVFKNNHAYRIGDIFQNAWSGLKNAEDYVLANMPDTILWKYLQVMRMRNFDPEIIGVGRKLLQKWYAEKKPHHILRAITLSHGSKKKWKIPSQQELVTHLRLGDVFQMNTEDGRIENTKSYLAKMWNLLPMDQFDRVTIVTAINFDGQNKRFTYREDTENQSRKMLEDHVQTAKKYCKVVEVKSSTPDEDFHYMVSAKHFARGRRRLSTVASQICIGKVYFSDKWGIFNLKGKHQPRAWFND